MRVIIDKKQHFAGGSGIHLWNSPGYNNDFLMTASAWIADAPSSPRA